MNRWISNEEIHAVADAALAEARAATANGEPKETESMRYFARLDDGLNELRRIASSAYNSEREAFENEFGRLMMIHADDLEWDVGRNCYRQFITHFAWKAWQARARYTPLRK